MNKFEVNNDIELGNAIWSSGVGDTIILKSGIYGNISIKDGVNYEFSNDATAADIFGLGIGGSQWSASSVTAGNISIKNPKIDRSNIKSYYIFQKKLSFNSRFEFPISFVHANGVIISVLGNDKERFALGGGSAENQLPKAIVNVIVPVLEEFDIRKANDDYSSSIITGDYTKNKKTKELKIHEEEKAKKDKAEKKDLNFSLGLGLNDFEYKGLWALNNFIREYAKIIGGKKIKGFSVSEFKDDLFFAMVNNLDDTIPFKSYSFVENFQNQKLEKEAVKNLSSAFLSAQEYSISDFAEFHLNHLNYPLAITGMYQEFESLWELYDPDKENKWGFIEKFTADSTVKAHLAEIINARNNIVHSRKLMTFHSKDINNLKTDWGAEKLNEYEIFAKKRPWYWNKTLQDFKTMYKDAQKH